MIEKLLKNYSLLKGVKNFVTYLIPSHIPQNIQIFPSQKGSRILTQMPISVKILMIY